ncbi:cupin domain-containing protein [Paramixta manurensis]|uniref:Cupin domain-containing protein n=1 Tax=Paramixta manurensis TaxID=2740817 RepID=A0A6M8UB56_9GAMM|nr:cupin domain-containing protein [Erwiniaceae bacterium PD-1]
MTDSIVERHTIHPADVTADAVFYEYSKAANPIGANIISRVPYHQFPASLYNHGATRVVPLDLSDQLHCAAPATGPGLLANFIRVTGGEKITLDPLATSQIFYVIGGFGVAEQNGKHIPLDSGSFLALPGGQPATLRAVSTLTLYYVNDAPLLAYLGVTQVTPRFSATLYSAERAEEELKKAAEDKEAGNRSRISVLLGNSHFPQTRTVTHVLWAMFGLLPANSVQKPHRHQSIALDFIVDCPQGCYSLVGTRLDEQGNIADATRVDWEPGMAFVTPPGYWHAHINESDRAAKLIPIQDAGLQTWLRSLDIRFS